MSTWLWAAALALVAASGAGAWRPPARALLQSPVPARARRDAAGATVHNIRLLGWHLELRENKAIRSPYYNKCQFYKGRVLYEEKSTATVTECDGLLYGLLQVGREEFVLQPTRAEGTHVLRRRDVVLAEQLVAYNLTGDTVTDLELDLEDEPSPRPHVRARHSSLTDTDYFRDVMPVTRPVSGVHGLWLELAIVADHTMLKFHGRERLKHYILALMNIVSAIFNDPSLNSNMTLVINKLYLYEEKDPVIKYGNVKKSLESVNKWNYRHLMKLPKGSTGWDAVVWLTRAPLGGPSGFAPVGGVCSTTRAAAIDRDEGLTSAFVIAHELGHLLGLTHDGDEQCPSEAHRGSVMSPTVLATLHNYSWSKCSKQQFHEKSEKWWCLQSKSGEDGVELGGAKELPSYVFSMDDQCRTEFGEGFSVCKTVKVRSACSRLWCAHKAMPHVCRSKRAPPMEGTPCGNNRWCVDQVCEPMPGQDTADVGGDDISGTAERLDLEQPAQSAWEEWEDWEDCNARCGYGVRTRRRRCRYTSVASESACDGASSQVTSCWAGACAAARDMRADACARNDARLIPHIHPDESKRCEAWCVDYAGGAASTYGLLPDGTPCSYDRPFDVCFQGTCVSGQCNVTDTKCNWCPGGNCNNNTHFYTRHLGKGWTRMTVLPHEAHQVSIYINTPVPLDIAIRERKRDKPILELTKHHRKRYEIEQNNYLKYDPSIPQNLQIIEVDSNVIDIKEEATFGWEGEVVAAGSLLRFKQSDADVFISSTGRLQTDLMIMAIPQRPIISEGRIPVQVSVNYSTPAAGHRPMEYRSSTERGPCSASCGGGVRLVRPRCLHERICALARYEACNTYSCQFIWAAGEWEECSATCGEDGVQLRQLFCVPTNASSTNRKELIAHSVSPALCSGGKPEHQQGCNRLLCPVYWKEMPWTPCSTSCGRGTSRRPLVCPAAEPALCGPAPRERRRRCRLRRCPAPRASTPCPVADAAQYCQLFTTEQLQRNCAVPPFRKYCCNACRSVDTTENHGVG